MTDDERDTALALPPDIATHYARGVEERRLAEGGKGVLELLRTQELVLRYLPPPPAVVLDVGGGTGVYAHWLAARGYEVHLIDPVPLHIEQASRGSASLASAMVGDARRLARPDAGADAVLMFGPLYHLTERADRLAAWREARRVTRPGGVVMAVAITRYASLLDGLWGLFEDAAFVAIAERDVRDGQHRNPMNHPAYFTTAYFHHPDELRAEVADAGLQHDATLAVEGPAWLAGWVEDQWREPTHRERVLAAVRWIEREPALLGVSAHLMEIAFA